MNRQETLHLTIEGMHCGACVNRVTTALERLAGTQVHKVEVGSAELLYNPQETSAEQITAAVNRIGYAARVAGE